MNSRVFCNKLGYGRHFNANVWGPSFWDMIHFSSLVYKPSQALDWKNFLRNFLPCAIPCEKCREHYVNHVKNLKRTDWTRILSCRNNLVFHLFDLHNKINKRLGKRFFSPVQFVNRYEKFRG